MQNRCEIRPGTEDWSRMSTAVPDIGVACSNPVFTGAPSATFGFLSANPEVNPSTTLQRWVTRSHHPSLGLRKSRPQTTDGKPPNHTTSQEMPSKPAPNSGIQVAGKACAI